MKIKKTAYTLKFVFSGITAFIILSVFCNFYYNLPTHIESVTKSTNHIWQKNKWHSRATEGFAFGRTDANGFNNVIAIDDVGILIMGSSQMEAFNVLYNQNTTYKLNELFKNNKKNLRAYNIGISGHNLLSCINNIENAVSEFSPSDYVILETQAYKFQIDTMRSLSEGTFQRDSSHTGKFSQLLQSSSYLRLLYKQYTELSKGTKKQSDHTVEPSREEYTYYINAILKKASDAMVDNCRLIIFLDDNLKFNDNNEIANRDKDFYYTTFKEACKSNNIIFIDMHKDFTDSYIKHHILPHGFSNTRVGKGHLNRHGHSIISKRLYDIIIEGENF